MNDKVVIDALKLIASRQITQPISSEAEQDRAVMIRCAREALIKVGFSALEWKDL